jgi:Ala-tRNA(Pro) deacylase
MTISAKIIQYLDENGIEYQIAEHPLAYTAAEVAGTQHIPGKQMVKAVIVKAGNEFIMCVLPAIHMVDFEKLKHVLGNEDLELAEEKELKGLFPEYDVGAEPPFGHLYGLRVYADSILEEDEDIVFNAGTHTDVVKLSFKDFKRLVKPQIAEIGSHI